MRKMPGPDENVERAGADLDEPEWVGVEDEGREQPSPGNEGQRQPDRERARPRAIAGDEEHAEQHNRKGEEDRRHRIGDRRVQDAGRHQEVEQEDDWEGQHQIGQER
jgi:hypothetical protein